MSSRIRERMIARYGYIASSSTMDDSDARNLGLFLSDYVVDVGPLHKPDKEILEEQGNNQEGHGERHSPASGVSDVSPSGRNSNETEMPLEELDLEWNMGLYDGSQASMPLVRREN
jgi:hypothetical protein